MSRGLALAGAIAIAVGVAACRPTAPPVTPTRAAWAQAKWPAMTQAELERGRGLFGDRCGGCHVLPSAGDRSPEEWPEQVAEMAERARLTVDERTSIERYLVTVASSE